jgi:hypothetical protein
MPSGRPPVIWAGPAHRSTAPVDRSDHRGPGGDQSAFLFASDRAGLLKNSTGSASRTSASFHTIFQTHMG